MGTWDTLRPASFRGVPFEVESHDETGGRRLARHDYPLRDLPYAEDMGRKAGEWRVEAFLVRRKGVDVADARDRLRDALRKPGPGTLVHPYLGELTVCVDDYRLRESTREGGYCSFSISFVESGINENPTRTIDTAWAVHDAADDAQTAADESFLDQFAPWADELKDASTALSRGLYGVADYMGQPVGWAGTVHSALEGLLATPEAFTGRLSGLLRSAASLGSLSTSRSTRRSTSVGALAGVLPRSGQPLTVTEQRATAPVLKLVGTTAAIESARATADVEYATADDALDARDDVVDAIDTITLSGVSDPVYAGLSDLRAAVTTDLTTRGAQLPHLARVTLPQTMPALVAAYRVHGDANRDAEIVTRNAIRHPGKVPGGVPLEVLDA